MKHYCKVFKVTAHRQPVTNSKFRQLLLALLLVLSGFSTQAQTKIGTYLRTCSSTANTVDFDIYIQNTSGNSAMILQSGAYGIDWDYTGTGGGTVKLDYIGGSQLNSSQRNFTTTNSFVDPNSHSIRINAQVVTNPSNGTAMPAGTDIRVGTFRLEKTSGNWTSGSMPHFAFNIAQAANKTTTQYTIYINGSSTAVAGQLSPLPAVESPCDNIVFGNSCVNGPVAKANGPYSSCKNVVLNGTLGGSATIATWSTSGNGIFIPNPTTLNATYQPSAADLASGGITLMLVSDNPNGPPCVPDTDFAAVSFVSCDDGNACTIDICDAQGICQHNPVNVDDGNPCTADGCNPSTGVFHNPITPSMPGAITGSTGVCVPVNAQAYSVANVAGITYNWTVPANVTIASGQGTNAITTNWASNALSGNVCVSATNTCGTSAQRCKTVTKRTAVPGTVGAITGSTVGCPGDVKLYTVRKLSTADLYRWTPPVGATINGSSAPFTTVDTMVNVTFTGSFNGDTLRVIGINCKGNSVTQRKLRISKANPATPGTITGQTSNLCNASGIVYSIAPVLNANTYTWATAIAGVTINGNPSPYTTASTSVTLNFGASGSGTLTVKANNGCGSSANKSLTLSSKVPSTPSVITGDAFGVCNKTAVPYSVTNVAGVTYNWSFTVATATIAGGQGTNAVTANFGATYVTGSIRVSATNGCGTSAFRTKVVKATPAASTVITGDPTVCANQQGVPYSTAALLGATTYTWTGPTGSHIVANGTTSPSNTITTTANAVTVNYATTAGTVKVRGNNACGGGLTKSLSITFVCRNADFEAEGNFDATVYPNPNAGNFSIQLFNKSDAPVIVEITDVAGRIIETIKTEEELIKYDKADLAKGVYLLRIMQNDKLLMKQLTVVK